jgi:membrane-associated protease RseP (regulator of RpoE activity)
MHYRKIIINPGDGYYVFSDSDTPKKENIKINLILFVATLITTTLVGGYMAGIQPFWSIKGIVGGLPFSLTLLTILGVHEFGHYFAARFWKINTTLPYFIPAPFAPIGTFGAVIKIKSSIPNRKALVDVGAIGPIAGFVVAVTASVIGLHYSTVVPLVLDNENIVIFGNSILFKVMSYLIIGPLQPNTDIMLSPVAYAGWLGLLVTALNLMPFGQLDGGHVLFALSPKIHELFRNIRMPLLLLMGFTLWSGWFVWAAILFFIGGPHPNPEYMDPKLGGWRSLIAVATMIVFVLCLIPIPVK